MTSELRISTEKGWKDSKELEVFVWNQYNVTPTCGEAGVMRAGTRILACRAGGWRHDNMIGLQTGVCVWGGGGGGVLVIYV